MNHRYKLGKYQIEKKFTYLYEDFIFSGHFLINDQQLFRNYRLECWLGNMLEQQPNWFHKSCIPQIAKLIRFISCLHQLLIFCSLVIFFINRSSVHYYSRLKYQKKLQVFNIYTPCYSLKMLYFNSVGQILGQGRRWVCQYSKSDIFREYNLS